MLNFNTIIFSSIFLIKRLMRLLVNWEQNLLLKLFLLHIYLYIHSCVIPILQMNQILRIAHCTYLNSAQRPNSFSTYCLNWSNCLYSASASWDLINWSHVVSRSFTKVYLFCTMQKCWGVGVLPAWQSSGSLA